MIYLIYVLLYLIIFIFGAVIGSFLNVLIYRIPRKISFVKGFSHCPSCDHRLHPIDLIPIISYLSVGRKCRYCREPISPRYMIVEIIGGLLAVASALAFMNPTAFLEPKFANLTSAAVILYFVVLCILLVITYIDNDTMEIPYSLNIALAICGIAAIWLGPDVPIVSRLIGLVAVSVPLFLISFFISGAFGGGDVLLMAAAGFFLGWQNVLVAFFIGLLIGGVYGIFVLITRKKGRKEHFAFGPALCIGIAVAMFVGKLIFSWYFSLL